MSPYALLGLALGALALAFVLYPLFRPETDRAALAEPGREREARRLELYRQILDLEQDERLGKVDPLDATQLSASLLAEAATLLAQETMPSEVDLQIEREIQAVRRALTRRSSEEPRLVES
jgi:hypothetical protein